MRASPPTAVPASLPSDLELDGSGPSTIPSSADSETARGIEEQRLLGAEHRAKAADEMRAETRRMAVAPTLIRTCQFRGFFCVGFCRHCRSDGLAISMRASCQRLRASRRLLEAARAASSGWSGGGAPSGAAGLRTGLGSFPQSAIDC